jgi:hypothetical protein
VGALLGNGDFPNNAILAVGRYVTTVDAPTGCQTPSIGDPCPEVKMHIRSFLTTSYSFRVQYGAQGKQLSVERAGPWWFTQPFGSHGSTE